MQEVSRVGAQGLTSKSKLLAQEMPRVQQRLAGQFRAGEIAQGRACAVWLKVDAPELSSGPVGEIQEVSRLGAQAVTSKSQLLAREMPRVSSVQQCTVHSEAFPKASAWGCASEGWAGSHLTSRCRWGLRALRLSIYPADADLQFFSVHLRPPIEPVGHLWRKWPGRASLAPGVFKPICRQVIWVTC